MTRFRDVLIGETFDFIGPDRSFNSFFSTCRKTSVRTYVAIEDEAHPIKVGSINVQVFNHKRHTTSNYWC